MGNIKSFLKPTVVKIIFAIALTISGPLMAGLGFGCAWAGGSYCGIIMAPSVFFLPPLYLSFLFEKGNTTIFNIILIVSFILWAYILAAIIVFILDKVFLTRKRLRLYTIIFLLIIFIGLPGWIALDSFFNFQIIGGKVVVCKAEETKLCPGGNQVARKDQKCEFEACPELPKDPTVDWKTYISPTHGFSFKYPQNLDITVTAVDHEVILSHKVAYKHDNPCDFVGRPDTPPLDYLVDFRVGFKLEGFTIEDILSDTTRSSYNYPKQEVVVGWLHGYKYTEGIEMCGTDYYYLAVPDWAPRTLRISKSIVTELSSIMPEEKVDEYLKIPGIINTEEADKLLNEIINTFKLSDSI